MATSENHSRKRPAPVTDTFFAFRGCPLTRASTVHVVFTPRHETFVLTISFDFDLQLSAIMTVANCLVDLIDVQGSSVLVCFEDGWDATPQVPHLSSVVQ